jgi:hypothetical protein
MTVGATVRVVGVDIEILWPENGIAWNRSYSAEGFDSLPLLAEIKVTANGDPRDSGKNLVRISSPKLAEFVAASPSRRVTLALAGSGIGKDALLFVSREKSADQGPKLVVKAPKEAPPDDKKKKKKSKR